MSWLEHDLQSQAKVSSHPLRLTRYMISCSHFLSLSFLLPSYVPAVLTVPVSVQ